jgi:hypothetical protein
VNSVGVEVITQDICGKLMGEKWQSVGQLWRKNGICCWASKLLVF